MAYVRWKTIGGNRYAYVQESYRQGGKVRTRHVRYIGGGSGGGSSGGNLGTTGGAEYKPGTDPVKTLVKQDKKKMAAAVAAGKKSISAEDHAKIKKHRAQKHDTKDKFFDKRTGEYKPKRKAMHDRMIQKIDNPNAFPQKGEKPKAIFIGGLSASGKTKAVGGLLDRIPGKPDHEAYPKYVYINSDDFKRWLPEYNGYNAGFVHEESSEIFDRALKVYRDQGKQVIIDATLKTTPKARDKMAVFKKAGYETVLLGTNIPGEKAIERATKRFNRSKRYVPLEFIKKAAEPTSKSVLKLRHRADDYKVFNTNVPKGSKPKLIESKLSLKLDRKQDAKFIVSKEKTWRQIGTDRADLKGYDTKKHKKVRVRI